MPNVLRVVFVLYVLGFSPRLALAQTATDSVFVARAASNAIALYEKNIRGQSSLYTGAEYVEPEQTHDEHPFYETDDWQYGSVNYNGEEYPNVGMLYDITSDILITEHYYNGDPMVLVKTKVNGFTLAGKKFVQLRGASFLPGLPVEGFYRVMYEGKTTVLARYEKQPEERIDAHEVLMKYTPKAKYFLLKDGTYHRISGRRDLLSLLQDKKRDVKNFIQEQKLRVSKKNPSSFALVAKFYDSLNSVN